MDESSQSKIIFFIHKENNFRRLALANMVSSQADAFGAPTAPSNAAAIKRNEDELQAQWGTPGLGFIEALHSTLSNYPLGQSPSLLLTDARDGLRFR